MLDNIGLLIQAPTLNIQLLLDGIFVGAIFALAAYGLALVWGVMNVKNLAQGDFVITGGYLAWWLSSRRPVEIGIPGTGINLVDWVPPAIHPIVSMPLVLVVMLGFGWLVYVTVIRRVIGRGLFPALFGGVGLGAVVGGLL